MTDIDPRIPAPARELWKALVNQVIWLHARWVLYRQLFGETPARVDLLNRSASTLFHTVQSVLLNDVQLALSKLGDPAGSGSRTNLTLAALVESLEQAGELDAVALLRPHVLAFDTSCAAVRHRRNKLIAHFDLNTMLHAEATPMEGPSRDELEAALEALRDAMNSIAVYYTESQMLYDAISLRHDGESLLDVLEQGLRYRELVRTGVIPYDDIHTGKAGRG